MCIPYSFDENDLYYSTILELPPVSRIFLVLCVYGLDISPPGRTYTPDYL